MVSHRFMEDRHINLRHVAIEALRGRIDGTGGRPREEGRAWRRNGARGRRGRAALS